MILLRKENLYRGADTMEEKLKYLNKYTLEKNSNVRLILPEDIKYIDTKGLPNEWRELFQEKDTKNRIKLLLEIWKHYLHKELSGTISYLNENLENIELMFVNGRYSILYSIRNSKGTLRFYEGLSPSDKIDNPKLAGVWKEFPLSIRNFYEYVHNGFYDYAFKAMGLVPLNFVTYLNDYEWSIIEDLSEPLKIDIKTSFGFFSNGMGGYVVYDYKDCNNYKATLWWKDDQPDYDIKFWDVVDEWNVIGFTE